MGFQTSVNYNWPQGFPGEIASSNPMRTVIPPNGAFRAGPEGLVIGLFAWVNKDGVTLRNGSGDKTTPPAGFVYRNQQGLTTEYLQESTMLIPAGFMATLANGGDFFAISGSLNATSGDAVYASTYDGTIAFAPPGQASSGFIDTGWTVTKGGAINTPVIITGPMTATRNPDVPVT